MLSAAHPPYRIQSDSESIYSLNNEDGFSVSSDTSTLRSLQLNDLDKYAHSSKEIGYGKGFDASIESSPPTPWHDIDASYLNDKVLPSVPKDGMQYLPESRQRSRSPARQPVLHRRRRIPSHHASVSKLPEQTPLEALQSALGADNIPHTLELDSIPCAGIRIPNGPFAGLLAWRLVVRVHPVKSGNHSTTASLRREMLLLPKTDVRHAGNMPQQRMVGPSHSGGYNPGSSHQNATDRKGSREEKASWRMSWDPSSRRGVVNGTNQGVQHGRAMSEVNTAPILGLPRPRGGYQSRALPGRVSSDSAASLPLGLVKSKSSNEADLRSPINLNEDEDGWILPSPQRPWAQASASSPALVPARGGGRGRAASASPTSRTPFLSLFSSQSQPQPQPPVSPLHSNANGAAAPYPNAVITNFLFDTSIGHNTISRETLCSMGFSARIIDALGASEMRDHYTSANYTPMGSAALGASYSGEPSLPVGPNPEPKTVSLYVQNLGRPITFRLAPAGEPSRLGVQFLLESDVNVCMGEGGRGGIMWVDWTMEKRVLLQNVPRTVPLPKLSLQAKVKALFGLA